MSNNSITKKPSVSVIVAVYNVEEYIAQCCHSLFSQTLKDIEYIFVNDCTPDNSITIVKSILENYPHRVHQVKIIEHPVNLGVGRTREDGVKAATGDYIIHCDPDDWIETDMYEKLYNTAVFESADIAMCDVFYHYAESSRNDYGIEKPKELSSRSVLASCLHAQRPTLHCYLCNKLIKSDYYKNIKWPSHISPYEDVIVCAQILQTPLKICYINQAYYYYRQRERTLSHRLYTKKTAENDYEVISILHRHLCHSGDVELYRFWQASVSEFLSFALYSPDPIYTNKEYLTRYRMFRKCILKDRSFSKKARLYLYCTTYNYTIPFFIKQLYLSIRNIASQ